MTAPSTTGPDLSAAKAAVEALMDDRATIVADYGDADATVDPDTLALTQGAPVMKYAGPVYLSKPTMQAYLDELGREQVQAIAQSASIPLTGSGYKAGGPIVRGDVLTVIATRRDPRLVGTVYTVSAVEAGTFAVKRTLRLIWRADLQAAS